MKVAPVAAVLLALASSAPAFQRETTDDPRCAEAPNVNCEHRGVPLEWRTFPVSFFIDPDSSGLSAGTVIDVAEAAFTTWQNASRNGITFRFGGTTSVGGSNGDDGRNVIHFRPFVGGRDTFAQSILTYDVETGELLDVDVELNDNFSFAVLPSGQNDPTDPRVDLPAVLTHEAGHLLGLDHENRFGPAVVMYFSDTTGNTSHRNLSGDDRSGVRTIYPTGGGDGDDDGDDDGDGGGCVAAGSAGGADRAAVLVLLLGLLVTLRARPGQTISSGLRRRRSLAPMTPSTKTTSQGRPGSASVSRAPRAASPRAFRPFA
jgi:hypothetical protein